MSKNTFVEPTVSQKLVIDVPEPSKGFSISHHEWISLKNKIQRFHIEKSFLESFGWKDFGMIFLGAALTIFISFWLPPGYPPNILNFAKVAMFALIIAGVASVFFQYQLDNKNRQHDEIKAESIIDIMNLIEKNRSCISEKDKIYNRD